MFWVALIIITVCFLLCVGFCHGVGKAKTDEQRQQEDEEQIAYLKEWSKNEKKSGR